MKTILTLLCLTGMATSFAQDIDFDNYKPLQCSGPIPQDFKNELSQLVQIANKENTGKTRAEINEDVSFTELSNYQLNNILFSGNVLYGDRLTAYINKVVDIILKDDPALRKKVHFYVLKNTDLNAYSTQKGIIFVSLGLLSQIENESQLAFILCHEIVHFRNNHNIESYKNKKKIFDSDDKDDLAIKEKLHELFKYNQAHESEADREGLDLFLKTPYSTASLNDLFDVMLYSYLPFDELPFDSSYFNTNKRYVFPKAYFIDSIADITAEEDVADSMSSHPNIKSRREAIKELLASKPQKNGSLFILPESEFNLIQRIARYEVAIQNLENAELADAFYDGYLIEKTYGKNKFSDKITSNAIYALSKHKNYYDEDKYNELLLNWKKKEGESQAVYHFFAQVPSKELNVLAASRLYSMYNTYHDTFFLERFKSSLRELVLEHDLSDSSFLNTITEAVVKDTTAAIVIKDSAEGTKKGKVSKIKKQKEKQDQKKKTTSGKEDYYKYAFTGMLEDNMLVNAFRECIDEKKETDKLAKNKKYQEYLTARNELENKHGKALGIDKFVMTDPVYIKIASQRVNTGYYIRTYYSKDSKLTPLKELETEAAMSKEIKQNAADLDLDVTLLGAVNQANLETEAFNDYQQLTRWISERTRLGKMGIFTYNDQYIEPYITQYGYLGYCYVINIDKLMYVNFVLFDLRSNGSKLVYEKALKKCKPNTRKSQLIFYDMLHQVKQQPLKINKLKNKYHINED